MLHRLRSAVVITRGKIALLLDRHVRCCMLHKDDGICLLPCSNTAMCVCLVVSMLALRSRIVRKQKALA